MQQGPSIAIGPDTFLFKPGDEVYFVGSILRQGTNSEFHLVDELFFEVRAV